jgi:hypothetical protein
MYSSSQTQNITNSYAQDTTTHINRSVSPTARTYIRASLPLPLRHQCQGQSCSRDLTTVPTFYKEQQVPPQRRLRHVIECLTLGSNVVPKPEVSRAATTVVFASARYSVDTIGTECAL